MVIIEGHKPLINSNALIPPVPVTTLDQFTLDAISDRLNTIDLQIALSHTTPFPRPHILSNYSFQRRSVILHPNGLIHGGYCNLVYSLIDFSFIRSLVAHCYSTKGPPLL